MTFQEIQDQFVSEKEISKVTGRSVFTLRNDRYLGRGFPYVKNSRQVRYSLQEVVRIMESKKIRPQG